MEVYTAARPAVKNFVNFPLIGEIHRFLRVCPAGSFIALGNGVENPNRPRTFFFLGLADDIDANDLGSQFLVLDLVRFVQLFQGGAAGLGVDSYQPGHVGRVEDDRLREIATGKPFAPVRLQHLPQDRLGRKR